MFRSYFRFHSVIIPHMKLKMNLFNRQAFFQSLPAENVAFYQAVSYIVRILTWLIHTGLTLTLSAFFAIKFFLNI